MMRFEDDFEDLPGRLHLKGVSPAWRVLGILASIAAGMFLLLAAGFGMALITRPKEMVKVPNVIPPAPVLQNQPGPMFPFVNAEDDADAEPANPPYPTVADLQPAILNARANKPKGGGKPTARERFMQLGQEIWASAPDEFPQVSVAPDGKQIAYLRGPSLQVGTIGGGFQAVIPNNWNIQPNLLAGGIRPLDIHPVGNVVWSDLGRYLYFADSEGGLNRYGPAAQRGEKLPFHGDNPLPMPLDSRKLIFRRSRAVPKVDLPSGLPEPDPTEIVLGNLETRQTRVLVAESRDEWMPLAISPNGKWLVLSSTQGVDMKEFGHARLFLLSLPGAGPADPKPTGPVCASISSASWELDSAAFLFARSQFPMPPDCYESEPAGFQPADLFRYDVDAGRETRLSRGGGFTAPSLDGDGNLLFISWKFEPGVGRAHLHRAPFADVLKFAEREPNPAPRDAAGWTRLFDAVLKEAGVAANSRGEQLTPDALAKLADVFAKVFREQFKAEPPSDDAGWGRLQRELGSLELPPAGRRSVALVMGAAEGEHLRRQHGAVWRLSPGPLRRRPSVISEAQESPFGYVFNPFETAGFSRFADEDDDEAWRSKDWTFWRLQQARGRPLILSNDLGEDKKAAEQLADSALGRAAELLKQNKGDEADRLLLDMMRQKKHEKNDYLAAHVARLLHEHKRLDAMRQLLEPRTRREPHDPPMHNLFGLALMDADPAAAIVQFKTALRCDLRYDAAYLNLAQAYQKTKDRESARLCLKRYLKLMPYGPLAQDVRQRLAALNEDDD